ncbi:MAG: spondin domain-containing protein [Chloroflexi bacterium]|nr:spondin domain-containing protein [Chloroflexota bacterium]
MSMDMSYSEGGVAAVPVDGDGPAPAFPGSAYEFVIHAQAGDSLTFATMLAQSNDGFLAPNEHGIALYDMGEPVSGDVTDQVYYWDLGTERNEPIGEGMYQAPRQPAPNSGPAGDGIVRLASDIDDGLSYPTADEIVTVTLTAGDMGAITVRIENVSDMGMYPSPITPVFWVVESRHKMDGDMMHDDDMMMDDMDMMSMDDMMMMSMDDMTMMMAEMMGMDDMDMMDADQMMMMAVMDMMMDADAMMSMDDMMMMSMDDMTMMMAEMMGMDDMDMMDADQMMMATVMDMMMDADAMMMDDMGGDMMHDDMMMKHGFLFTSGASDYGHGLESLAEDGDPSALAAHHGIGMDDMMMDGMMMHDMMMQMDDMMMDDM